MGIFAMCEFMAWGLPYTVNDVERWLNYDRTDIGSRISAQQRFL